jgi:hypothetical protein
MMQMFLCPYTSVFSSSNPRAVAKYPDYRGRVSRFATLAGDLVSTDIPGGQPRDGPGGRAMAATDKLCMYLETIQ